jgi:hemerythrin
MIVDLEVIPQVAVDFINEDHRREGQLVNELAQAITDHRAGKGPAEAIAARWDALLVHTREHFGREEAAMQQTGFPPFAVHKGEHERVLAEMSAEGRSFRERGDVERLWRYVTVAVPAWFVEHIDTMDNVTAQFIASRDDG